MRPVGTVLGSETGRRVTGRPSFLSWKQIGSEMTTGLVPLAKGRDVRSMDSRESVDESHGKVEEASVRALPSSASDARH